MPLSKLYLDRMRLTNSGWILKGTSAMKRGHEDVGHAAGGDGLDPLVVSQLAKCGFYINVYKLISIYKYKYSYL